MKDKKVTLRNKRKFRIRKKIKGTSEVPRLTVFRSNRHFIIQAIDDDAGKTLVSANSLEKELKGKAKNNNVKAAQQVALVLAERAGKKGIKKMVFDRNGYAYHGRVKQIAESLREHGIQI